MGKVFTAEQLAAAIQAEDAAIERTQASMVVHLGERFPLVPVLEDFNPLATPDVKQIDWTATRLLVSDFPDDEIRLGEFNTYQDVVRVVPAEHTLDGRRTRSPLMFELGVGGLTNELAHRLKCRIFVNGGDAIELYGEIKLYEDGYHVNFARKKGTSFLHDPWQLSVSPARTTLIDAMQRASIEAEFYLLDAEDKTRRGPTE